jgi:Tfp pilus assembly protein FimT
MIDLMIAVAVVGISAGVAINSLSQSTTQASAQYEAERVRDAILQARNIARYQLKCVTVDVQPDHIDITPYSQCSPLLLPDPTQTIKFAAVMTLAPFDSGNPLTFNTLGGTVAANPSTMTATSTFGRAYSYTIMPAIGTVSMR